jgi:hypothetical protein
MNKTAAAMTTTTTTPSEEMTTTNNEESEMTINNESQMTVENDGTNESDENVDAKKKTATAAKKKGGSKSSAGGKGSRGANSPLSFENWTHDDFLGLCAMSGCDFLENVRNVGFKKAHAFVNKNDRCAKTALEMMSKDPKIDVPEGYVEKWQRAVYTFRHALIYDVKEKTLKHLTPLPEELLGKTSDELDFWAKYSRTKLRLKSQKEEWIPSRGVRLITRNRTFNKDTIIITITCITCNRRTRDRKFQKSTSILCLRRRKLPLPRLQLQ